MLRWIEGWQLTRSGSPLLYIIVGAGSFGAAMGYWRAPLQALYCGIKLPLIMVLTAAANALINGMLAPLLGVNLSMRQSFGAVLSSFALASIILGAFSPLVAFFIWNAPPLSGHDLQSAGVHNAMLSSLVYIVAFAGITANLRLFQLLRVFGGGDGEGLRLLFAWLGINLLLGSQISWILRPFIGAPGLEVVFLRPDAFHGSFFETFFSAL
jgi:hypothetical protein